MFAFHAQLSRIPYTQSIGYNVTLSVDDTGKLTKKKCDSFVDAVREGDKASNCV